MKHKKLVTMAISTKQRTGWLGLGWRETFLFAILDLLILEPCYFKNTVFKNK